MSIFGMKLGGNEKLLFCQWQFNGKNSQKFYSSYVERMFYDAKNMGVSEIGRMYFNLLYVETVNVSRGCVRRGAFINSHFKWAEA